MAATPAQIRTWAAEQGLMDPDGRGRIPASVRAAFEDAQAGTPEADAGPGPETSGPAFTPDPDPVRPRADMPRPPRRGKVSDATVKDIRAKVTLLLMLPAGWFRGRDPVCGTVLLEQLPEISAALADIMADSPDVVAFFTSAGGTYIKWMNLAVAVQPVAQIAYQHHIAKRAGADGAGTEYEPADMSQFHAPAL